MIAVFPFSGALLCGMILFVSGAPVSTKGQIPARLNERLTTGKLGNISVDHTWHRGKTCPDKLLNSGEMQDLSTCPWYTKVITDSTLFPSVRSEVACRCQECIGSNGMHICEVVYSEMVFLARTSVCVDGLYVYEPVTKRIPTGCVCAHKKRAQNPSNYDYDI